MADTQGQVGFKAIGRVPVRSHANDLMGVAPAPGWQSAYDWTAWLPYEQTPELSNAQIVARGWHATANQRITLQGYAHFLTSDWNSPERFERIRQLLDMGVDFELAATHAKSGEEVDVLQTWVRCEGLGEEVSLLLTVLDLDDVRGQLKPDARGRTRMGSAHALQTLLESAHD